MDYRKGREWTKADKPHVVEPSSGGHFHVYRYSQIKGDGVQVLLEMVCCVPCHCPSARTDSLVWPVIFASLAIARVGVIEVEKDLTDVSPTASRLSEVSLESPFRTEHQ